MSALRIAALTALIPFVTPAAALAVAPHEGHDLEIRRPAVAAKVGHPGRPAISVANGRVAFARAGEPDAVVDAAARALIASDRTFFRVREGAALSKMRTSTFSDRMTYVSYVQSHRGLEIVDSDVTMIFRDGRHVLSTRVAFDDVAIDVTPRRTAADAERVAIVSLAARGAAVAGAESAPELVIYPQESGTALRYRLAWRLVVKTDRPIGRFRTIVAADGTDEILQRTNLVAFDAAQVLIEVEPRTVGDTPVAVPAKGIRIGADIAADMDGIFEATPGDVSLTVRGPWFTVNNAQGAERTKNISVTGGGFASYLWSAGEGSLDELDTFYHANLVRERQVNLSPDLGFLQQTFPVNVNVSGSCNAFFDGSSINFFPAGGQCNSTGRISDVVYHEYGHGIHFYLTNGNLNSQIQEGVADYFAHTITDDPNMGPYFFVGQVNGIRNATQVRTYPTGVQGDFAAVHESGKIWTNTWWLLRQRMIAKHGRALGVKYTDILHTNTLRGNPGYTTAYMMALAADDDDATLANGTPNSCEITAEFQAHGLVQTAQPTRGFLALSHEPPVSAGFTQDVGADVAVQVEVESKSPSCGGLAAGSVKLHWRVDGGAVQELTLTGTGETFSGAIPAQPEGSVVEYWFSAAESAVGAEFTAPLFAPANAYRYYVGTLNTVFSDDFEQDRGWTHGGDRASEDDWERGTPGGHGLWDPEAAFSGSTVWGNDIGVRNGNGLVEKNASNWLESPAIDCSECEGARLQFRRWLSTQAGANGDVARVLVNGNEVWSSADYEGVFVDRHWELVDIPIADIADGAGEVRIRFEMATNGSLELGGWAIDDVEIVATAGGVPPGEEPGTPGAPGMQSALDGGCTCTLTGTSGAPRGLAASLLAALAIVIRLRRRR